jgi:hypothetical protein
MHRRTRSTVALTLSVGVAAAPLAGQSRTAAPAGFAGCYTLSLGAWTRPPGGDARYHAVPPVVHLDTLPVEHAGWQLRPNIAYPHGSRVPWPPRWLVKGDSVELAWSNGFQPTVLSLARRADGSLRGRAVALSDAEVAGEPPPPRASVTARRAACPPGFAP